MLFQKALLLIFLGVFLISLKALIQSNGNGNWTDGTSWVGGVAPAVGDVITLNADIIIRELTINSGGILIQNNNQELTLTGDFTYNRFFDRNELNSGGVAHVIGKTGLYATLINQLVQITYA